MVTFQTWLQAEAYYTVCFEADSVRIRDPHPVQTPIHSPVHKKQKLGKGSSLTHPKVLTQPYLASAGSLSHTGLDHKISAAAHHFLAPQANSTPTWSLSHTGLDHKILAATHHFLVPQANSTPTPSPQVFIPHPHRIIFEDSSDDSIVATASITNTEENSQLSYRNLAQAAPTPSFPVEVNSNPPAIHNQAPSIILVLDSEEEELAVFNSDIKCHFKCPSPLPKYPVTSSSTSSIIVISDSEEEEFHFDSETEHDLNKLYSIKKPGPPPCFHQRL